jgi:hypothetical protein
VDLWCLFDYVQPGLLGALNDFGRRYRRPIEAETEEERARVKELRERISPQILRRTKAEVAKDLPPKRDIPSRVLLSSHQRSLYAHSINLFKARAEPEAISPFKNHLGLLHYLRLICTDPRPVGLSVFRPEPIDNSKPGPHQPAHGQEARTTDYLMTNRVENLTSARESIGAGYLLVSGEAVVAAGAATGLLSAGASCLVVAPRKATVPASTMQISHIASHKRLERPSPRSARSTETGDVPVGNRLINRSATLRASNNSAPPSASRAMIGASV